MQVFCLATMESADVQCRVCGQNYALYFDKSHEAQEEAVKLVLEALEQHHANGAASTAHPEKAFTVPQWHGAPHMSGAAILGGAPPWAA